MNKNNLEGFQVITIDGESACGKSSLGISLSNKLKYYHIDSGNLFRTLAYAIEINNVNRSKVNEKYLEDIFKKNCSFKNAQIFYLDKDITQLIHSERIGRLASEIGRIEKIQEWFIGYQKKMEGDIKARGNKGVVVSGRIGGSVTFPHAWKKFYLKASLQTKANRRYTQLLKLGHTTLNFEDVLNSIIQRDAIKEIINYRKVDLPNETIVIDTTSLDIDSLFERICSICSL